MTTDKVAETSIEVRGESHAYTTTKFAYEDAIELQAMVLQLIGDSADFSRSLGSVFSGLGGAIIRLGGAKFTYRLLKRTIRDGVKLDRDSAVQEAYEGNLAELALALEWVIRVNFADFFDDGVRPLVRERLLAPLIQMLANGGLGASWMRPTPTGPSTPSPPTSDSP